VKARKERITIPKEIERKLLVQSGHKCSVPLCNESHTLEIHHINGDPSDNKESNLIVFCRNHHAMAESGKIDRKECKSYKERLEQIRPEETLEEKVAREGIDVQAESGLVSSILWLGRKYMMWRYGKPTASIKREIMVLGVLTLLSFVPLIYISFVLKSQVTVEWLYFEIVSAIIGFILLMILAVISERRCRKCNGYFGVEAIDSKLVSEKHFKDRIVRVFRNTYRCIYCGDTFIKNEKETEHLSD
jgi:hypothetical protein